jgi:hypothetical protein
MTGMIGHNGHSVKAVSSLTPETMNPLNFGVTYFEYLRQ